MDGTLPVVGDQAVALSGGESPCMVTRRLTAVIEREGDGYVAPCPEVGVASQGDTIARAHANLQEALTLFFQIARPAEVADHLHGEVYVTTLNVVVG